MRVLLVDGTNSYLRNYAVVPTLDKNGSRIGGVYGMLTTLSYFCRTLTPDRVIIVWDGPGGSKKRKKLFKEYKDGRKPIAPARINKNYEFEEEDIEENRRWQRVRLAEYLEELPISQVSIEDIEADDVIAYLTQLHKDDRIIIASDDKDFYQLLNDRVIIFRPTKKVFYTKKTLKEEFNIYAQNFALARAMAGDASDNLSGVKRVGLKNLLKYFPFMSDPEEVTIEQLLQFSMEKVADKDKKYQKFLDAEQTIKDGYKIVQLKNPLISYSNIDLIHESLQKSIRFDPTVLRMYLTSDGIFSVGENFIQQFKWLYMRGKEKWIK